MNGKTDSNSVVGISEYGAAKPLPCFELQRNGILILNGHQCKILELCGSKTGKHGHGKIHVAGIDLVTAEKFEEIFPSNQIVQVLVC